MHGGYSRTTTVDFLRYLDCLQQLSFETIERLNTFLRPR